MVGGYELDRTKHDGTVFMEVTHDENHFMTH